MTRRVGSTRREENETISSLESEGISELRVDMAKETARVGIGEVHIVRDKEHDSVFITGRR